jgi:alginate biosynthesis protein Alg44
MGRFLKGKETMKTAQQGQIVHESETQRQHVRLPLPAHAEIGGREYDIKDLSSGGVGVKDIEGNYTRGQHLPLRLKLPFGTFALDVTFEAEVQHYSPKEKSLGCVFVNLTSEHISLLNHMLKAYLAGDLIASSDLIGIASRDNFTKTRKQGGTNAGVHDIKKQLPGLITVGVIGLIIAMFILSNLYSSLFIVKSNDATVSAPTVEMRAASEGFYHSKLDAGASVVHPNQVIGQVTPADGRAPTDIKSPCNCLIVTQNAPDGAFVQAGKTVVTLVTTDAKPWVTAQVDPTLAVKVGTDTPASITVFGAKTQYTGHVVSMESGISDPAQPFVTHPVLMKIVTDQKLPVDLTNRPAAVSFTVR